MNLLSKQYRDPKTKRVFHLGEDNPTFKKTYNQIQSQLRALGGMDELLCGEHAENMYFIMHCSKAPKGAPHTN